MRADINNLLNGSLNYNRGYDENREYFIVSTIATIARNPKACEGINKLYEENKEILVSLSTLKENPFLKYKKILKPTLWNDFDKGANLVFYTLENLSNEESFSLITKFLNVASCVNSDFRNLMKLSNLPSNATDMLLQKQLNRIKKGIMNLSKNKNRNVASSLIKEIEVLILLMTCVNEFLGRATLLECDEVSYEHIYQMIYSFVVFYETSVSNPKTRERIHELSLEHYKKEIDFFYDAINLSKTTPEFSISELLTKVHSLYLNQTNKIIQLSKGTIWEEVISRNSVNVFDLLLIRSNLGFDLWGIDENVSEMLYDTTDRLDFHSTGSLTAECDDLLISKELLNLVIISVLVESKALRPNPQVLFTIIVQKARISALIKCYDDELDNRTKTSVIEIVKKDTKLEDKYRKALNEISNLKQTLLVKSNIEDENEKLKLEIERLNKELQKKSNKDKELLAYAKMQKFDLTSENDSLYSEESEEELLENKVNYLKELPLIFIGGAEKYIQSVRDLLPNIVYYSPDHLNKNVGSKLRSYKGTVVYNTQYNTHGMHYMVMPIIKSSEDIRLITLNNHPNIKLLINYLYESIKEESIKEE